MFFSCANETEICPLGLDVLRLETLPVFVKTEIEKILQDNWEVISGSPMGVLPDEDYLASVLLQSVVSIVWSYIVLISELKSLWAFGEVAVETTTIKICALF